MEQAIDYLNQAIILVPKRHLGPPFQLSTLDFLFHCTKHPTSDTSALDQNVDQKSRDIAQAPQGCQNLVSLLDYLSSALGSRFSCLGHAADLRKAIEYGGQAVFHMPEGEPSMPCLLHNLSSLLNARFEYFGDISDLNNAINYESLAVSYSPMDNPDISALFLNALGILLFTRFERLDDPIDLG